MGFFKIKNITSLLGKRNSKSNKSLLIDISSQFNENKVNLSPDSEFVMEANFLPINIHKMRTEGLISVVEITKNDFQSAQQATKKVVESPQQTEVKPIVEAVVENVEKKSTVTKPVTKKPTL